MPLLTRQRESRAQWQTGAHPRDPALVKWFSGDETSAGESVTPDTAMTLSAVIACVRLLSETMASLPLDLYRILPNNEREVDVEHPLYALLKRRPNRWQTPFEFRDYLGHSFLLRGFAAAEIFPSPEGYPFGELVPLHPERVKPFKAPDGSRAYEYQPKVGTPRVILQEEMLYVPFLPDDGYNAVSVIRHAAEVIGAAIASDRSASSFFSNDATPSGFLKHPQVMSAEAQKRLIDSWNERHQGARKRRRLGVLEEGMEFQQITISPEDAQAIETRRWNTNELARLFLIPPHMIGDVAGSTSWGSGIEQQGIGFVTYTMRSMLARFEQAMMRDLMTDETRRRYFIEFNVDGLLRGDIKSRYEAYAIGKQWGWLTTNKILRRENMNGIGPDGDVLLQPLNMTVASEDGLALNQRADAAEKLRRGGWDPADILEAVGLPAMAYVGPPTPPPMDQMPPPDNGGRGARLMATYRPLFADAATRAIRREATEIRKAARRCSSRDELLAWLDGFHTEHRAATLRTVTPVVRAYAEALAEGADVAAFVETYAAGLTERLLADSREAVVFAPADVGPTLDAWTSRAEAIARNEVVREAGAAARELQCAAGRTHVRWVRGDDCAICAALDGRVVGIDAPFVTDGERFTVDGQEVIGKRAMHAPIHDGCMCSVEGT